MFTGIVAARGRVIQAGQGRLGIHHTETARQLAVGGSVAVNGACLTAVDLDGSAFFAEVVPETLRRTNLGELEEGDEVNLELPLRLDRGLDGHLVQGHVDGTAGIRKIDSADLGREVEIELPKDLAPYVAEKGSIAVDGTSLTVARLDAENGTFTIALIPHTLETTIAGSYEAGTRVNLEVDLVARYVERLLKP